MLAIALLAALFQAPDTVPIYDSLETRALVERAIEATREIPAELRDYRARVQSSLYVTVAPDSVAGGDLPASVDEIVSTLQWERTGSLHQEVQGHRTRLLIPLPYTLATIFQRPWIIPHLYGTSLYTPFAGPRAISPFGLRGPEVYQYVAEDTVVIEVQGQRVSLVPVSVRPRVKTSAQIPLLVLGTFYLDTERAAVARARFGFIGDEGVLPASLGRLESFFELDNALWNGRFWLPFQQRREILLNSPLMGGAVAARVLNRFMELDLNTGWQPTGERVRLTWGSRPDAFADWRADVGADAGEYSTQDFDDLRIATETADPGRTGLRVGVNYERANHLFRYNRVEGPYLGIGGRLTPADTRRDRWQLYGTAGWAFAEGTPRGELSARWGQQVAASQQPGVDWGAQVGVYRRLHDIQPFRPSYNWDLIYTLPALLWGSDQRDYYDVRGAEAGATFRSGRWTGRLGGRVESQDSVEVHTGSYLFGVAKEFGPLAGIEPGTHAAIEAGGGYALGPGAFGIGNSAILHADAELGVGDFRFTRLVGLASLRYGLGPFTLATRVDGGHAFGGPPPQRLFRFGSTEGLRGYEANEFGGSTALLARARFLTGLPPRSTTPIARVGWFLVPPLRPSLVLVGESGWTRIDADQADELARLRARPTDGARAALGLGISILEDAFTFEYLRPVGEHASEREGRWYIGMTYWY
ncbi:MAG: hypothetical protein KY464_13375 [Gemmatimonadetes bacterium]|nr:hypothetical protein [Gemmatimonadota bacterium]